MKTKFLMFYDDARKPMGDIASKSAIKFCEKFGFEPIIIYKPSFNIEGYYAKVPLIRENLNDCDWLVYSDADIVFRGDITKLDGLVNAPLNISTDGGLCTGFMILQNIESVRKLINIWADLGESINLPLQDQGVFKLLYDNFQWIQDMVYGIPQSLISNPWTKNKNNEFEIGSIAHHFWSSANNCTENMQKMHDMFN